MSDFGAVHIHMGLQKNILRSTSIVSGISGISVGDLTVEDDWVPENTITQSSLPHVGFSARNEDWNGVQKSIVALFHRKALTPVEMRAFVNKVKAVIKSDIGPFIIDYYKNQLLKKGCWSLRETINKDTDSGTDVLFALSEIWDYFYKEILPVVQFALHPVHTKNHSIRQVTLLGFRDHVLLKLHGLGEALESVHREVAPQIEQMLMVLQSVVDSVPPSVQFLQLEKMVGRVINPYLGYEGLYMGKREPFIKAKRTPSIKRQKEDRSASTSDVRPMSLQLAQEKSNTSQNSLSHFRQASIPNVLSTLAPVDENDIDWRRHSMSVL